MSDLYDRYGVCIGQGMFPHTFAYRSLRGLYMALEDLGLNTGDIERMLSRLVHDEAITSSARCLARDLQERKRIQEATTPKDGPAVPSPEAISAALSSGSAE